jgi:hypothetical protein
MGIGEPDSFLLCPWSKWVRRAAPRRAASSVRACERWQASGLGGAPGGAGARVGAAAQAGFSSRQTWPSQVSRTTWSPSRPFRYG